jgi:hypothetical protein
LVFVNPTQIIALVKDVAIVAFGVWLFLFIRHSGQDSLKLADAQAAAKQQQAAFAQQAQWAADAKTAGEKRDQEIASIKSAVDAQRTPIILRVPSGPGPVSGHPPAPAGTDPASGPVAGGTGVDLDIRPAINAFEERWEQGPLASCRLLYESWPK